MNITITVVCILISLKYSEKGIEFILGNTDYFWLFKIAVGVIGAYFVAGIVEVIKRIVRVYYR
ncbi:hypothetical protein KAR91_15995 [Candidatus Pacearchaeota archaeon]|nr:hypothetical protein [Candidatus Pacearchaeota archaeon]